MVSSLSIIDTAIVKIGDRFKMRSLGDISFYLGCRIIRNRLEQKPYLVQDAYIKQLLEKKQMQSAKAVLSPMEVNNRLKKASEEYTASPNVRSGM